MQIHQVQTILQCFHKIHLEEYKYSHFELLTQLVFLYSNTEPAKIWHFWKKAKIKSKYFHGKQAHKTHAVSLHKHVQTSGLLTTAPGYKKSSLKNTFANQALIFNVLWNHSAFAAVRQVDPHLKVQGGFKLVPWLPCICVAREMGHGWGQCLTSQRAQLVEQECLCS